MPVVWDWTQPGPVSPEPSTSGLEHEVVGLAALATLPGECVARVSHLCAQSVTLERGSYTRRRWRACATQSAVSAVLADPNAALPAGARRMTHEEREGDRASGVRSVWGSVRGASHVCACLLACAHVQSASTQSSRRWRNRCACDSVVSHFSRLHDLILSHSLALSLDARACMHAVANKHLSQQRPFARRGEPDRLLACASSDQQLS